MVKALGESLSPRRDSIDVDTELLAILSLHPENDDGMLGLQTELGRLDGYIPPSTPMDPPGRQRDRDAISTHFDHVYISTPRHWITLGHTDGQAAGQPTAHSEGRKLWFLWDMRTSQTNKHAVARMHAADSEMLDVEWAIRNLEDLMVCILEPNQTLMLPMGCIHACLSLTLSFHVGFEFYDRNLIDEGLTQLEWTLAVFDEIVDTAGLEGVNEGYLTTTHLQAERWKLAFDGYPLEQSKRTRLEEVWNRVETLYKEVC